MAEGFTALVPGHGTVGGREMLASQLGYHEEVERILSSSRDAPSARAAIRSRWPDWRLEAAIATAVARRWP